VLGLGDQAFVSGGLQLAQALGEQRLIAVTPPAALVEPLRPEDERPSETAKPAASSARTPPPSSRTVVWLSGFDRHGGYAAIKRKAQELNAEDIPF
jgi:hypothetical protein